MSAKCYDDKVKCPKGHRTTVLRRIGTAGKTVRTYCRMCQCAYQIKAGPAPATSTAAQPDAGKLQALRDEFDRKMADPFTRIMAERATTAAQAATDQAKG